MAEWKLFEGDVPHVSTFDFHKDRERAPHWEQPVHRSRLELARSYLEVASATRRSWVDLGCGDGGLLAATKHNFWTAYGYDFQPSNVYGWAERGLNQTCYSMDFVEHWESVRDADVYSITEVLEHLADPHKMVRQIYDRGAWIVASSPFTEHADSHDECHAWAWNSEGYARMMQNAGFTVSGHSTTGMFQVLWGTQ